MSYRRHPERNIVLTGYHHAGKTIIGRAAARRLHRPFIDVREELLRRQRIRFPVLSGSRRGMIGADPEVRLLQDLSFRRGTVIALDASSLEAPGNLEDLQVFSFVVFLDPPFEELWRREEEHRRFARPPEFPERWLDEAEWRARYERLREQYLDADLVLDVQRMDTDSAVRMIQHCFYT